MTSRCSMREILFFTKFLLHLYPITMFYSTANSSLSCRIIWFVNPFPSEYEGLLIFKPRSHLLFVKNKLTTLSFRQNIVKKKKQSIKLSKRLVYTLCGEKCKKKHVTYKKVHQNLVFETPPKLTNALSLDFDAKTTTTMGCGQGQVVSKSQDPNSAGCGSTKLLSLKSKDTQ